jgi:hypothetical protein
MIECSKNLSLDSETDIVKSRSSCCNICWGNEKGEYFNKKMLICKGCSTHVHEECYYSSE